MNVALLLRIEGSNADGKGNKVGLAIGEVIRRAREVRGIAVNGEETSRHVIVSAQCSNSSGVIRSNSPVLRVAVPARRRNAWDPQIVDHPTFVPTGLIVNH